MQELRLYNHKIEDMKGTGKYSHRYMCDYCKENPCPVSYCRDPYSKYACDVCLIAWWAFNIERQPLFVTGSDKPFMLRSNQNSRMAIRPNQSPYMVKKRIVDGKKTWGFVLENRKKPFKITKDEVINLVENYPKSVQVDFAGADMPVYLTVIEEIKEGNVKKYLRTIWDTTIKNNLNSVKAIKLISCNKLKVFKTPEKNLIAV
jgi:hypothetical protein